MNVSKRPSNKKTIIIGGAALVLVAIIILVIMLTRAKPAAFSITDLSIDPVQVQPEQQVRIGAVVTNSGGSTGTFNAELKINDSLEQTQSLTLAAQESKPISFSISRKIPGTYTIEINSLTGQFTIVKPVVEPVITPVVKPAVFQLTNLVIQPAVARRGQPVSITATVTNAGGSAGEYSTELKVNGKITKTQSVSLTAGENKQVVFTCSENTTGTYAVNVGNLAGEFKIRPVELRTWVVTDADIPRLFAMISKVPLTSHFIPGNQAEFVMAGFPGVIDIGVINGKLCEFPVSPEVYASLPEIHKYIFFENGVEYLSFTWFDPSIEIAPDVTTMPVMVSVTTEDGRAIVTYEW
jgi:hypothetical protein